MAANSLNLTVVRSISSYVTISQLFVHFITDSKNMKTIQSSTIKMLLQIIFYTVSKAQVQKYMGRKNKSHFHSWDVYRKH